MRLIQVFLILINIGGVALSHEKRLIKHLLDNYARVGRIGRPVNNISETIRVRYGLALIQILDLDEKNQILTTNCWCRYTWKDILLSWDPLVYGGVDHVRIPTPNIWIPDIVLYNYADDRLSEHRSAYAVVNHDGNVLWIPQAIFKSSCVIDITNFPFDKQNCSLKFGSWTYDGFKLDVDFYDDVDRIDLNDYVESNEWEVIGHPARKNVRYYPCCNEPFPDLTFTLMLSRKVAFYNYILILPCVLLSSLTVVLFWLPPESPAKMVLGMNIFVAFFVLLLLLADSTPPAASTIPLIGAYYCLNMILITLSTFLSVIVINLYYRGDKRQKLPAYLKTIFIDVLAKLLCMRTDALDKAATLEKYMKAADSDNCMWPREPDMRNNKECPLKKGEGHDSELLLAKGICRNDTERHLPRSVIGDRSMRHLVGGVCSDDSECPLSTRVHRHSERPLRRGIRRHSERPLERGVRPTYGVEADVREIRGYMRAMLVRLDDDVLQDILALEWRILALVLDRIFFFMYLTCILASLITIFPKTY